MATSSAGVPLDSLVTREQIAELKEVFDFFDRNGDGTISANELGEAARLMGHNLSPEEELEIMKEADVDGSGEISFPEFLVVFAARLQYTESDIHEAFKVFDPEGLGYIKTDDFRKILTTRGDMMSLEEANEMIAEADQDGDGYIRYDEFTKVIFEDIRPRSSGNQSSS